MSKSYKELRDWYAGLAMQALFGVHKGTGIGERIAEDAFDMAKIMWRHQRSPIVMRTSPTIRETQSNRRALSLQRVSNALNVL